MQSKRKLSHRVINIDTIRAEWMLFSDGLLLYVLLRIRSKKRRYLRVIQVDREILMIISLRFLGIYENTRGY